MSWIVFTFLVIYGSIRLTLENPRAFRAQLRAIDEPELAAALTVHVRRRVRRDGTLDLDGASWQVDESFLAGMVVTVAVDKTGAMPPVVHYDGGRYILRPVDAIAAGKTQRKRPTPGQPPRVPFDPAGALLDRAAGRPPRHRPEEP